MNSIDKFASSFKRKSIKVLKRSDSRPALRRKSVKVQKNVHGVEKKAVVSSLLSPRQDSFNEKLRKDWNFPLTSTKYQQKRRSLSTGVLPISDDRRYSSPKQEWIGKAMLDFGKLNLARSSIELGQKGTLLNKSDPARTPQLLTQNKGRCRTLSGREIVERRSSYKSRGLSVTKVDTTAEAVLPAISEVSMNNFSTPDSMEAQIEEAFREIYDVNSLVDTFTPETNDVIIENPFESILDNDDVPSICGSCCKSLPRIADIGSSRETLIGSCPGSSSMSLQTLPSCSSLPSIPEYRISSSLTEDKLIDEETLDSEEWDSEFTRGRSNAYFQVCNFCGERHHEGLVHVHKDMSTDFVDLSHKAEQLQINWDIALDSSKTIVWI